MVIKDIKIFKKIKGINMKNNSEVAVKLEPVTTKHPQLNYEAKLY